MTSDFRYRIVVLGADHPTGLGTARALRGLSVEIVGLSLDPEHECCRSRVWNRIVGVDDEGEGTLARLRDLARIPGFPETVIIPACDSMVKLLSDNRDELGRNFRFVLPEKEIVDLLLDKTAFHQWAIGRSFPVPESVVVCSYGELGCASRKIQYPVLLKPFFRSTKWEKESPSHKIYLLERESDIAEIPFDLFKASERYLVQKWIPGEDSDVHFCLAYFDREGQEAGMYTGRKIIQWRVGTGSTAICTSTENEEIRILTREIFCSARFCGLGSLEYKKSTTDGRYYITEPTIGRNNLQSYVAVAGGVNLTRLAFLDALGMKEECRSPGPKKATWLDEKGLYYALSYLRKKGKPSLKNLVREIKGKRPFSFAYWEFMDPFPFVLMVWNVLIRRIKKNVTSVK